MITSITTSSKSLWVKKLGQFCQEIFTLVLKLNSCFRKKNVAVYLNFWLSPSL